MRINAIQNLANEWRQQAEWLCSRGLQQEANFLESCAADLYNRLDAWWREPLTLTEAADEADLSYDCVQKKVGGELPNVGRKGSPRVRRMDLFGGEPPEVPPKEKRRRSHTRQGRCTVCANNESGLNNGGQDA